MKPGFILCIQREEISKMSEKKGQVSITVLDGAGGSICQDIDFPTIWSTERGPASRKRCGMTNPRSKRWIKQYLRCAHPLA